MGIAIPKSNVSPGRTIPLPCNGGRSVCSILRLFFPSRPLAVFGGIVPIIVDAVQRVLRRGPWSHIGEEVSKRRHPPAADYNPPASVSVVMDGLRVVASVLHALPRIVFPGSTQAVFRFTAWRPVAATSASFGRARSERLANNISKLPAVASAMPNAFLVAIRENSFKNHQLPKSLPNQISSRVHIPPYTPCCL